MNIPSGPPTKPILSLCMIVKNERENLPRCLTSAKPYVQEMIVVDTGSDDGTPEIAANYGAKVSFFEWCDDFAAARNYAISQASGDWILVLDADEELIVELDNFIEKLTLKSDVLAYLVGIHQVHDCEENVTVEYSVKLFRNISSLRYVYRYHEQLKYDNHFLSLNQFHTIDGLKLLHYGNTKECERQKNISRSIPMLERIRQKEGLSLTLLYTLAKMYDRTQQSEKAQGCYVEAFERLLPNLMDGNRPDEFLFVPMLLYKLGAQAIVNKDYETARLICQRSLEWCPNYPPISYLAGVTLKELGFFLGAAVYFKNCLRMGREGDYYKYEPFGIFYMTKIPAYALGCVYLDLGQMQEALAAFELALSFDANFTAAQEKIDFIKQFFRKSDI